MYTIVKQTDGKFRCIGHVQDGTELWVEDTIEKAIDSMKSFARYVNHDDNLKKKHIEYLQDVQKVVWTTKPWDRKA